MTDRWNEVWASRTVGEVAAGASTLEALMAADGLDTAFGAVSADAWSRFSLSVAQRLGLEEGDSVFEVGCGAGAFLYPLAEHRIEVSGIDRSPGLIDAARRILTSGDFAVGDAAEVPAEPRADAVVSCGVFLYFPDLAYAERVIAAMVAKASRAVAILDVPDLALREQALTERMAALGGKEAYEARYEGLDHRYYEREWLTEQLRRHGLTDVESAAQSIDGYENGRFRFNAWGFTRRRRRRSPLSLSISAS